MQPISPTVGLQVEAEVGVGFPIWDSAQIGIPILIASFGEAYAIGAGDSGFVSGISGCDHASRGPARDFVWILQPV